MKKSLQIMVAVVMLLLAIFPSLVIYDGLSQALPILPNYRAPDWMMPAGFISIALIIILAFLISKLGK
ncbi:hypothetical protein [Gracilibacillus alcaliphilus]|uniref:hypothetical protein n=1 Tax=Gracilibacillus alcaliphilus TaxID=1401441 RepID=UPI001956FE81|nr:hypothetical protein [Gracilibacillus alcaliphilus]MBM7676174.1 hypothetical protein [Gracilibacillus alcaliphilus]